MRELEGNQYDYTTKNMESQVSYLGSGRWENMEAEQK